jgi:hypothetical protein
MTDLLTRLALRAVGEGLQVRPRAQPAYGGADSIDGDATPDLRRDSPRAATTLHDPGDDAARVQDRDAASRGPAPARGTGRYALHAEGVAAPADEAFDAPAAAQALRAGPLPSEPSPHAFDDDTRAAAPAGPSAFARTADLDAFDPEGEAHARAPNAASAPAVPATARPGMRGRAASNPAPDLRHPQPVDIAVEAPQADALPDRMSAYPGDMPAHARAGDSRAAPRRGAAPHPATAPPHAAPREEPIVHVTIGRVEIRASVPAAPAAPRPAPAGPRPLSLGDYLASRKGATR